MADSDNKTIAMATTKDSETGSISEIVEPPVLMATRNFRQKTTNVGGNIEQ